MNHVEGEEGQEEWYEEEAEEYLNMDEWTEYGMTDGETEDVGNIVDDDHNFGVYVIFDVIEPKSESPEPTSYTASPAGRRRKPSISPLRPLTSCYSPCRCSSHTSRTDSSFAFTSTTARTTMPTSTHANSTSTTCIMNSPSITNLDVGYFKIDLSITDLDVDCFKMDFNDKEQVYDEHDSFDSKGCRVGLGDNSAVNHELVSKDRCTKVFLKDARVCSDLVHADCSKQQTTAASQLAASAAIAARRVSIARESRSPDGAGDPFGSRVSMGTAMGIRPENAAADDPRTGLQGVAMGIRPANAAADDPRTGLQSGSGAEKEG